MNIRSLQGGGKMEVKAIVDCNATKAVVLKEELDYEYERYGSIIVGLDSTGTFAKVYLYNNRLASGERAFGGRKFKLPLKSGEVVECKGEWWFGVNARVEEIVGGELIEVAYGVEKSLKGCYVYTAAYAVASKLDEIIAGYNGKTYDYWEYEKELKQTTN